VGWLDRAMKTAEYEGLESSLSRPFGLALGDMLSRPLVTFLKPTSTKAASSGAGGLSEEARGSPGFLFRPFARLPFDRVM